MINKLLLSTAALAALAGTAFAADLPSRRAPPVYAPPPIPVFSWTGVYVGGQVGYEFGRDSSFAFSNITGAALTPGASRKTSGVIGGAHIGYNFSTQSLPFFSGVLGTGGVFGIEGDVDGSSTRANYPVGPAITATYREPIQGSIRGRLGVAVDRVLFYATGGAAFGNLKNTYAFGPIVDGSSTTRVGYTVGGGIEYAVTNNWSLRAEYRYTDFGNSSNVLTNITAGGASVRHRDTDNRVQAGFSYKFDTFTPTPVVARY